MRENAKLELARQLRKSETRAEKLLWQELRNRKLDGHKFVRQAPAGPYIADFMCREQRLIVEVDGATHASDDEIASDRARSAHLVTLGYTIIRLQNIEVLEAMDQALTVIKEALARSPHLPCVPQGVLSRLRERLKDEINNLSRLRERTIRHRRIG